MKKKRKQNQRLNRDLTYWCELIPTSAASLQQTAPNHHTLLYEETTLRHLFSLAMLFDRREKNDQDLTYAYLYEQKPKSKEKTTRAKAKSK